MKTRKFIIVSVLLVAAILLSYSLPKAKYEGTGFISRLQIPDVIAGWHGKDVRAQVGLNINTSTYNFISEAFAHQYINKEGKNLIFIILDAGNFHHPKVCFTGAGFKINEMNDKEFTISPNSLLTHALFTERGNDTFLSFYWIVIDKNVAHDWVEQKIKQLFFSLFGKKRVGLMVRVDIPTTKEDIGNATVLAQEFITELNNVLNQEQSEYIFGSN